MSEARCVRVVIRGRVQGVGFRAWTRGQAGRRDLAGHVRNRADGAVEAVFHGPAEAVEAVLRACREGPSGARVDDLAVADLDPARAPDGPFEVLG